MDPSARASRNANEAAGRVQAHLTAGQLGQAVQIGRQALAEAERQFQPLAAAPVMLVLAQVAGHIGQYQWSQSLAGQARRLCEQAGDHHRARWGEVYSALAAAELGQEWQALTTLGQILWEMARDLEAPNREAELASAQCLAAGVWLAGSAPDAPDRAWYLALAALNSAQKSGPGWVAMVSLAHLAAVHLRLGERARALTKSAQSIGLFEAAGRAAGHEPLLYFTHAQALRAQGDSRALWYMQRARQTLAGRALSLSERRFRRSYLYGVRLNRAIGRH